MRLRCAVAAADSLQKHPLGGGRKVELKEEEERAFNFRRVESVYLWTGAGGMNREGREGTEWNCVCYGGFWGRGRGGTRDKSDT